MVDQPGVWGIDIGQCALKALRVVLIDGQVTATAFDYVEHPKILSQPDADPDLLTREALEKFLSRNSLKGDTVCISVPGQSGLARFVKLPPVEEKKIVDIVRFEAKQQIPFNLDEVVWDYQKIGSGVVSDGFAMETEIGLFAMKRDMINRALQHFQDVNVEVHVVQMAPLALCNFVTYDLLGKGVGDAAPPASSEEGSEERRPGPKPAGAKKSCVVALDIGADSSNLVITDGERIIWQRPIPLGGNNFTRVLTKDLKLTFAKAEHLKRNATKSPDLKKILASLKPVLNDFVGEVQRSLGYFTNTHRDAQIEYLMGLGGAFRLPGLQRFLSEKLQLEVRKLQKLERLAGDEVITAPQFTENVLSFAVAYGLALQGLQQTRLQTNLLPPEIRVERLVRAKKPWAVASAAALLFGIAGLALSYNLEIRAVDVESVRQAIAEGDKIKKEADGYKSQFEAQQRKVIEEEEAVKSVIAGQDERLNWVELMKFVNDALPRPDDKGEDINLLYPKAKELYWTAAAKRAYEKYRQRLAQGGSGLGTGYDLVEGIGDLVQLSIEAVDCRYTDDLSSYWTLVTDKRMGAEISSLRPRGSHNSPPTGPGWVVELRGFTYHKNADSFVIDSLVENLARLSEAQVGPPPADATGAAATTAPATSPAAVPPGAGPTPPATAAPTASAIAPAAPPATGAAAPTEGAPPEGGKRVHPIKGRVSHVMMFKARVSKQYDPYNFEMISGSVLPALTGGQGLGLGLGGEGGRDAAAPPASPEGGAPGPEGVGGGLAGGGRAAWQPLPFGSAGLGGTFGGGPFGEGRGLMGPFGGGPAALGPAAPGPAALGGPGAVRLGPGTAPPLTERTTPGTPREGVPPGTQVAKQVPRTEFIILFVWKEPIPSDKLQPGASTEAAPAP
ncbi:MAG TPA: type IV pilus assembly protein PilM [Gemmataceae bacterium]|nr:type IV pilus assembly protein PilM [Gemmataceae bacterium]